MDFKDAISIASLYLALVGLLATFFFVQLTQWLNSINATEAKWKKVEGRSKTEFLNNYLECYHESVQYSSNWTFISWIAITLFLIIISIFEEVLRFNLDIKSNQIICYYVAWPGLIFLFIYIVLSIVMLSMGYKKAKKIKQETEKAITQ